MEGYFTFDTYFVQKKITVKIFIHNAETDKITGTFVLDKLENSECSKLRKFLRNMYNKEEATFERDNGRASIELFTDEDAAKSLTFQINDGISSNFDSEIIFNVGEDPFMDLIDFLKMGDDEKYEFLYGRFYEDEIKKLERENPNYTLHMEHEEIQAHVDKLWAKSHRNPMKM